MGYLSGQRAAGGRQRAVLLAAMAVLLAGVAATGCGSNISASAGGSSVPNSSGNGGAGSPAAGSPAGGSPGPGSPAAGSPAPGSPAPASPAASTASSPPPQSNGDFPYEPGGVTYSGDEGAVDTFSIPAGSYSLNQQASYDPENDPYDSGECLFSGELDYLSGSGSIQLGVTSPITSMSPINGPATIVNLPAGDYRLYIYPTTTCSWTVELWS